MAFSISEKTKRALELLDRAHHFEHMAHNPGMMATLGGPDEMRRQAAECRAASYALSREVHGTAFVGRM